MIKLLKDEEIRKLVRELIDLCTMVDKAMKEDPESSIEWYYGPRIDALQHTLFLTPEEEFSIMDQMVS